MRTAIVLIVLVLLAASCGGGGGGGTIAPPPGGGGGGGGSLYPQHYTTDLDGVWTTSSSNLSFSYMDPNHMLDASTRAELEAEMRDAFADSDNEPGEILNGREVVGTLPTLGYDSLQITENRVSKLSATQYEKVYRLVGSATSNGQVVDIEIEGIAAGFLSADKTVWSGSGSVALAMSSGGQGFTITTYFDFVDTRTSGSA